MPKFNIKLFTLLTDQWKKAIKCWCIHVNMKINHRTPRRNMSRSPLTQELKGIIPTQTEKLKGAYQVTITTTARWAI